MASADTKEEVAAMKSAATHAARVEDWQSAVGLVSALLTDLGVAEPRYGQACIDSVQANGPYIVLTKGLALAHARPSEGATGLGVAALRLAEPVEFGHPTNDPVDLVLAFCTPDDTMHLELIQRLARALMTGLAASLRNARADELGARLAEGVGDA